MLLKNKNNKDFNDPCTAGVHLLQRLSRSCPRHHSGWCRSSYRLNTGTRRWCRELERFANSHQEQATGWNIWEYIYNMRIAVSLWVMWAGMLGRVKLKLWVCFRIGRFEKTDVRVEIICCFLLFLLQNNVYGWLVAMEAVFTYIYLFTVCLQTGGREQNTEGLL